MILITGASGFIGSHVLGSLLKEGVEAVGLDIATWSKTKNFKLTTPADSHINVCDIRDKDAVLSLLQFLKPEAVIHLAAKVGVRDSLLDPVGYLETNVIGTQNLLDACVKAGVKTVVLASTSSVYGNTESQVETDLPKPRSPYAASKLGMEALGRVYHELYGMNIAILRLFSVYGERVRPDLMISQIMESITAGTPIILFSNGEMYRDWTYIGDVVEGIRAALNIEGCEVLNIARGWSVQLKDILTTLETMSGRRANVSYTDAPLTEPFATRANILKARKLIGYKPEVDIGEGLRRTWEWHIETHPSADSHSFDARIEQSVYDAIIGLGRRGSY